MNPLRPNNKSNNILSSSSSMRRFINLVEVMRLQTMLLESRVDFLKTRFVPILSKLLQDGLFIPSSIVKKLPIPPRNTENLADFNAGVLFDYILGVDPDPAKKNSQWLLTIVTRKKDPMPLEDLEYAGESLTKFAQLKKEKIIPSNTDINQLKSLSELNSLLRGGQENKETSSKSEEMEMLHQSRVVYDGSDYRILIPLTEKSACYFGQNTEWCTAWGNHLKLGLSTQGRYPTRANQFDSYNSRGPMFIITDKTTGDIWQFHFASNQFMDVNDHPVNLTQFLKTHKKVDDILNSMDGEPIGDFNGHPVYAHGKGFVVKTSGGPSGKILLMANVDDNGVLANLTGSHAKSQNGILSGSDLQQKLKAFFIKLNIKGDPEGDPVLGGVFYRNGKWGDIDLLGKVLYKFGDPTLLGHPIVWKQLTGHKATYLIMKTDEADVFANIQDGVFEITEYTGDIYSTVEQQSSKNSAKTSGKQLSNDVSEGITQFLVKDSGVIINWSNDSKIVSSQLLKDNARSLATEKSHLADILTVYTAHGVSDTFKKELVDLFRSDDVDFNFYNPNKKQYFIDDNLIIEYYKDVEDMIDNLGTGSADDFMEILSGHRHFDVDTSSDSGDVDDYIKNLDQETRKNLGEYLQNEYPSEAEEIEDFNPSSPRDILDLIEISGDSEIQSIADSALSTGLEVGGQNELSKIFWDAIKENNYLIFLDESGNKVEPRYDTPCYSVVPISEIISIMKRDGISDFIYEVTSEGWSNLIGDEFMVNMQYPYNGLTDYDEESANERFKEEILELIGK